MSNTNSKNFSFIVAFLVIAAFVFAYVILSNNLGDTIHTDIRGVLVEEEDE